MTIQSPPIYERISGDDGKATLPWILFMNQLFGGDSGTDWIPEFTNLTEDGDATFSGRYYKLSNYLVFFRATIVPATSTSSTAESTYISNFPLLFKGDGICFAVRGGAGTNSGHIIASNNRIYVPAWSTVTTQLSIIGIGEAT